MVHVASYLILLTVLVVLIAKSRNSQEHAVIVTVFRDRIALAVGGVFMFGNLVTDFVHDGFSGGMNGLVPAVVVGFVGSAY